MSYIDKFEAGDTIQLSWVDSSISAIDGSSLYVFSGSETVVATGTLTSSGNGHWYWDYTIDSGHQGYYRMRSVVTVGGNPYIRSTRFKVINNEVD